MASRSESSLTLTTRAPITSESQQRLPEILNSPAGLAYYFAISDVSIRSLMSILACALNWNTNSPPVAFSRLWRLFSPTTLMSLSAKSEPFNRAQLDLTLFPSKSILFESALDTQVITPYFIFEAIDTDTINVYVNHPKLPRSSFSVSALAYYLIIDLLEYDLLNQRCKTELPYIASRDEFSFLMLRLISMIANDAHLVSGSFFNVNYHHDLEQSDPHMIILNPSVSAPIDVLQAVQFLPLGYNSSTTLYPKMPLPVTLTHCSIQFRTVLTKAPLSAQMAIAFANLTYEFNADRLLFPPLQSNASIPEFIYSHQPRNYILPRAIPHELQHKILRYRFLNEFDSLVPISHDATITSVALDEASLGFCIDSMNLSITSQGFAALSLGVLFLISPRWKTTVSHLPFVFTQHGEHPSLIRLSIHAFPLHPWVPNEPKESPPWQIIQSREEIHELANTRLHDMINSSHSNQCSQHYSNVLKDAQQWSFPMIQSRRRHR